MFFSRIDNKTPGKLISKKVLYDINTAEELASTRSKKKTDWYSVYKKKNGQLFIGHIEKDDDSGELYLCSVITESEKIEEYMSSCFSIKHYETVYGKVEE